MTTETIAEEIVYRLNKQINAILGDWAEELMTNREAVDMIACTAAEAAEWMESLHQLEVIGLQAENAKHQG